ncbi:MAG: hypothetical protein CMK09_08610 [Ponticaulis sp.]|jgi:hypothetical protein|nr:hypothetical protein [Ponticaulis sp.]|tara:strand:- start:738 stop:1061 length:324 start_codon:yes stop_codon:yes gene_type:complete
MMEDKELDALIASVLKSRPLKDTRDFRDAVWAKIERQQSWPDRCREALRPFLPALSFRAAPAALSLVIGGLSGAAMAQSTEQDDLAVFDVGSVYAMLSLVASEKETH